MVKVSKCEFSDYTSSFIVSLRLLLCFVVSSVASVFVLFIDREREREREREAKFHSIIKNT
jgi:hypothetical protein